MASSSPDPLALVRRITTASVTAAAVGASFVAVHLAGDHAASATSSATSQNVVLPQDQAPSQQQYPSDPGGGSGFAPVAPLGGGGVPQGSTRGS
jgi:hypothetical protein